MGENSFGDAVSPRNKTLNLSAVTKDVSVKHFNKLSATLHPHFGDSIVTLCQFFNFSVTISLELIRANFTKRNCFFALISRDLIHLAFSQIANQPDELVLALSIV